METNQGAGIMQHEWRHSADKRDQRVSISTVRLVLLFVMLPAVLQAQERSVTVTVMSGGSAISAARVAAAPVPGSRASVVAVTDTSGRAALILAQGQWLLTVARPGFRASSADLRVNVDTAVTFNLLPFAAETLAPVIVGTSRITRHIRDEPERVETLAGEDVDEKSVMRPADPTRLLAEMPGVRVQPVGASLGGAGIRLSRYNRAEMGSSGV